MAGNGARGKAQCAPLTPAAASPSVPPVMNSRWIALAAAAAVAALAALALTGDDADAQARLNFDDFPLVEEGLIVGDIGHRIDTTLPAASGGRGQIQYSLSPLLPHGLEFNTNTRRLHGVPQGNSGHYMLDYEAVDAANNTAKVIISLWLNGSGTTGSDLGTLVHSIERLGGSLNASSVRYPYPDTRGLGRGVEPYIEPSYSAGWRYAGYTFTLNKITELTIRLRTLGGRDDTELSLMPIRLEEDRLRWGDFRRTVLLRGSSDGTITVNALPGRYWVGIENRYNHSEGRTYGGRSTLFYQLFIDSPDFDTLPPVGQILAKRHNSDGRIEFWWRVYGSRDEIKPELRFLPINSPTNRWLSTSDIIYRGTNIGRINIRRNSADGRIQYAFTPTGGERVQPRIGEGNWPANLLPSGLTTLGFDRRLVSSPTISERIWWDQSPQQTQNLDINK